MPEQKYIAVGHKGTSVQKHSVSGREKFRMQSAYKQPPRIVFYIFYQHVELAFLTDNSVIVALFKYRLQIVGASAVSGESSDQFAESVIGRPGYEYYKMQMVRHYGILEYAGIRKLQRDLSELSGNQAA